MNAESINQIFSKLDQISNDPSTIDLLKNLLKNLKSCNKCGNIIDPDKLPKTEVKIHWGYNSTGKDTDCDIWNLCRSCTEEFNSKFAPICVECKKDIREVMADLAHKNPHSRFYGTFSEALSYFSSKNHYGLEYAKINARIFCEICYENFISEFKLPIAAGSYDCFTGEYLPEEGSQRTSRIEQAFNFKLDGDTHTKILEDWLSFEETVSLRAAPDASQRVFRLSVRTNKIDFIKYMESRGHLCEDTISFTMGDGTYKQLPISKLEESARTQNKNFQLSAAKIINNGYEISFDAFSIKSSEIESI